MASINTGMPKISRNYDKCRTGHRCTARAPCLSTQYRVFANGIPILRQGDPVKPHLIRRGLKCVGHRASVIGSSNNVFVANIKVARFDDRADRGSMIQGSLNVFANGF